MSSSQNLNEIKVFKPKAVVLGFHGTIAPVHWEQEIIWPYINQNLMQYLTDNWNNNTISQSVLNLKDEAFNQHFVYENSECPVISEDEDNPKEQIKSVNDFLLWQINCQKQTIDSKRIFKMVWMEGIDKQEIKVPIFEDVVPALKRFKDIHHLKIALFSTTDRRICENLFRNTERGDISIYFDMYFDNETGSSKDIRSFTKIAEQLNVEPKDILYVIDYGQSAKCAKELNIQCLIIVRPHNTRVREYYFLRFDKIHSLLEISFVNRD